jgi:predicted PP-loop superfamily ATPase
MFTKEMLLVRLCVVLSAAALIMSVLALAIAVHGDEIRPLWGRLADWSHSAGPPPMRDVHRKTPGPNRIQRVQREVEARDRERTEAK